MTTSLQTLTSAADTIAYTYNPAGNLTSATDSQNTGGTQAQCYAYDNLRELTTAWTDTKGTTTAPAPSVTGIGGCVTTSPSASTIGGPAPYWQTYAYDLLGDRTQAVFHDTSGNTANDLTQTLTYPGSGTTPAVRPDAPATITTRRGASGGPSTTLTATYDPAGNTVSRTVSATTGTSPPPGPAALSTVTYNPGGLTAKATASGGTSGYTYDASGSLLLQTTPAGTTVYLDGGTEQITRTSTGTTALRYYPGPDGTTITRRYDNAAKTTTLTDQTTDPQGTSTEAIDAATQAITRRYYDPYGNPTGHAPSSWPGNHAYLGKPADPATALDLLGARNYDPATGRFLTLDPLPQPGNPTAMGGYTYANGNPATYSDPTGLCPTDRCPTGTPEPGGGTNTSPGNGNGGPAGCPPTEPGCPGYGPPGGNPSPLNFSNVGAALNLPKLNLTSLAHLPACYGPTVGVSCSVGDFSWTTFINRAAAISAILSLIPVVDVVAAPVAVVTGILAVVTNLYNGAQQLFRREFLKGSLNIGAGILGGFGSFVGAGAISEGLAAGRASGAAAQAGSGLARRVLALNRDDPLASLGGLSGFRNLVSASVIPYEEARAAAQLSEGIAAAAQLRTMGVSLAGLSYTFATIPAEGF